MVQLAIQIAKNCILMQVPVAIENPYQSTIWGTIGFKNFTNIPGVVSTRVDFCQFGEKYHKKTKLVSFDFDVTSISKVCKTKGGKCPRPGEPHELLSGAVECPNGQLHMLDDKGQN